MYARFLGAALLAIVCCFQAQAAEPIAKIEIPDAPDKAAEAILKALSKHELQVLWQMLPPKYQADIKQLQKEIGENKTIGAEMWKLHFETIGLTGKIAASKKEFVLNNEGIKTFLEGAKINDAYDLYVKLVDCIFNSDLSSFKTIAQLDPERFLATTGKQTIELLSALQKQGDSIPLGAQLPLPIEFSFIEDLKDVKVTVEKLDGDRATLRLSLTEEKNQEMEWQRIDGRWIPADLATAWPDGIKSFREQFVAGWVKEKITDQEKLELNKLMEKIKLVQKQLQEMEKVTTQGDFDAALLKTFLQLQQNEESDVPEAKLK